MNEENLIKYYNKFNEEKRLLRRHGIVEFNTCMHFINKYLSDMNNPKILDIGAGAGRYSITLADKGFDVTAIELVKHNLRKIEKASNKVNAILGNATNLSMFSDKSFDLIIMFGPMYHLISKDEKITAINEAKRVLKDNGILMIQYYMNDYAIMKHGFIDSNIINSINTGVVDSNYKIHSKSDDLYSYMRLEDIDELNNICNLKRINILTPDGLTDLLRDKINKLDEDTFDEYLKYHLSVCEKKETFFYASHILDVLRK